jgi:predicted MFS family arabinose efflux permease
LSETSGPGTLRAAWRHRDFRTLLVSHGVSYTGDFFYIVALAVDLLERGSPGWVAAGLAIRFLPFILFSGIGGVIADRYDRRALMTVLDLLRASLMAALMLAAAAQWPPIVLIGLSALVGTVTTPHVPAVFASTPALVPEGDLAAANAAQGLVTQLGVFIGPALASGVLAATSPEVAFAVNGLSFLLSAALVRRLPRLRPVALDEGVETSEPRTGWLRQMTHSVGVLRATPGVSTVLVFGLAFIVVFGAEQVLIVVVADELLGLGAEGVGYITAATGIGGIVVAPLCARVANSRRPGLGLVVAGFLQGLPIVFVSVFHEPAIAAIFFVAEGMGVVLYEVLETTLLQRFLPSDAVARVYGVHTSLIYAAQVVGVVLAPIAESAFGLRTTLVVLGVSLAAFTLLILPRLVALGRRTTAELDAVRPVIDELASLGLFAGASELALAQLAGTLTVENVGAGTTVIAQGDPADDLFVVHEGRVEVWSTGEGGGPERLINSTGTGSWFGEIGVIERLPRTATVKTVVPTVLWRIPGEAFLEAVSSAPIFPVSVRRSLVNRLAVTHPSHTAAFD